jgi:calcineurin-like phosphoesterase family protein
LIEITKKKKEIYTHPFLSIHKEMFTVIKSQEKNLLTVFYPIQTHMNESQSRFVYVILWSFDVHTYTVSVPFFGTSLETLSWKWSNLK